MLIRLNVKLWSTFHVTHHLTFEDDWGNIKLNRLKREKSERQTSWQQMEHAQLYPHLLQAQL